MEVLCAVCQSFALLVLFCGQLYAATLGLPAVIETPLVHSFIVVTALLASYQVFADWAQEKLVRKSQVRLADAVDRVRLLTESHTAEGAVSGQFVERFILPLKSWHDIPSQAGRGGPS